jgi:hypothetical protein
LSEVRSKQASYRAAADDADSHSRTQCPLSDDRVSPPL